MNLLRTLTFLLFALVPAVTATASAAERVEIKSGTFTLNGNLVLADGKTIADGVVLITHGTLTHNGMETITALQSVLADRDTGSLAINLSLGLDNRDGAYDCATPHRHRHFDALDEIGAWVDWLKGKGASSVVLMGHSRGGNQTAVFAAERADATVSKVVLLAPMLSDPDAEAKDYEAKYGTASAPILDRAKGLVAEGKGGAMLSKTGFIYCKDAEVTAEAFVSYYDPVPRRHTPAVLPQIKAPVLVIGRERGHGGQGLGGGRRSPGRGRNHPPHGRRRLRPFLPRLLRRGGRGRRGRIPIRMSCERTTREENMMRISVFIVAICLAVLVGSATAFAETKPADTRALTGVTTGKVVWDISMANPETLAVYLSVVRETYDDLKHQTVEPDMVLAIHGVPVRYLRKDMSDLPFESGPHIEKINAILDDLRERPGVRIEVCSVANRLMGVNNGDIREGLHVVGNTWVSLIGYQAQGYAVIPIQ